MSRATSTLLTNVWPLSGLPDPDSSTKRRSITLSFWRTRRRRSLTQCRCCPWPVAIRHLTARLADELHARGGRLSWYVCCWPPIPNTFLHSPLVEGELHGWLTFYLKLDGFLRWAFCLWPADPWRRVSWRAPHWNAGDMFFVLPGQDGAPVETLRYEALRAAAQDYELLALVERTLSADQAQAVLERAFALILRTDAISDLADVASARAEDLYSLDPQDYQAARRLLLEAVAQAG